MHMTVGGRWLLRIGLAAVLACLCTGDAQTQNPTLNPKYGSVTLKSGFTPDPYVKLVIAGGRIKTTRGGVSAWVANAPDFKLHYEAGNLPLTIYVESEADTTLLVNLPDGNWVANDDGGANRNPLLRFATPRSGRYDIWVGTFGEETAPAVLKITEVQQRTSRDRQGAMVP